MSTFKIVLIAVATTMVVVTIAARVQPIRSVVGL